jgi:hypothetical protein
MTVSTDDRLHLHELAALYGDCIDGRDWDGLARVFVDDIVWDNPARPDATLRGLAEVQSFMAGARHPIAHHITNIRVDDDGDDVKLHSRVILVRDDGSTMSGEYHDTVVETDAGWRIARRTFVARGPFRPRQ